MKFKNITIDDGLSRINKPTGIGNYSKLLLQSLQSYIAKNEDNINVKYRDYSFFYLFPRKLRRLLYLFLINLFGLTEKAGIFHFTNYYTPIVKKRGLRYIVTIHDMAAWEFPQAFSPDYLKFIRSVIKRGIYKSDSIITVSQSVKSEICNIFSVPENKICVCHNAVKPIFKSFNSTGKDRYILFVGIIAPQKNLSTLIGAFAKLKNKPKYGNLKLVISGKKDSGMAELESAIRMRSLEKHVSILGYITDSEMVRLYNNAQALVIPSLYEGFGIPIIEAMACRVPVIASDIPVFREIAGDAALFYGHPRDQNLLCEAIDKVLSDESLKGNLISRADKQVLKYTWENVAKNHLEAYNIACA